MSFDEASHEVTYEIGREMNRYDTLPIRWSRVIPSGILVGILVWPILGLVIGYLVPESMWRDPSLLEIWIEFLMGSGILSGILVLSLMRQRRLAHVLLTIAVSAPISVVVLLVIAFVTHR
jgi:hypothetical protein